MTFVAPLHPAVRAFLCDLWSARAAHLQCDLGVPEDAAKTEADKLARAIRDAFRDGRLTLMEPNVICREIAAGQVPEEFEDGPIFHPAVTLDVTPSPAREEAA